MYNKIVNKLGMKLLHLSIQDVMYNFNVSIPAYEW